MPYPEDENLPPGMIRLRPSEKITPIVYDWKELYYQAILAITESEAVKASQPLSKPLQEQLARHRCMMSMQLIITDCDPSVCHE